MPQVPSADSSWSKAQTAVPAEYLTADDNVGTPNSMGAAGFTPNTTPYTPRELGSAPLLFQWSDAFNSDGSDSGS